MCLFGVNTLYLFECILVFAVQFYNSPALFADNSRQEIAALVKDFSTAWNCVRSSLVNYG